MSGSLVIFDNHMHLSEQGNPINAVNAFRKNGGTHLNFCPYSDIELVIRDRSYLKCYECGMKLANHIAKETEVPIFLTCGPYPIDYIKLQERIGRDDALSVMKKGIDEAYRLCLEKKVIAIGEIGRPHFPVDQKILEDSNEILQYGMEIARDVGVPVLVHMETATKSNMLELAQMARKVGFPPERVIKHYAPPLVTQEETSGIFPSIIASESNIIAALGKGRRFMLETDFLDDQKRPGAVLALHTIPKKINSLLQRGILNDDAVIKLNKENPERMYGISLN